MKLLNYKKTIFFSCLIAINLLLACENEDNSIGPDKRPLLIGKAWVTVQYELDGEDITGDMDECDLDNFSVFFEDDTFIDDVGEIVCDEFDVNVEGTWQFKGNQTILSLKPAGESATDWQLLEITESTLKISQYVDWLGGNLTVVMEPVNG